MRMTLGARDIRARARSIVLIMIAAVALVVPVSAAGATGSGDGTVVAAHAGEQWFLGRVPTRAVAADPTEPPILLGMINQEDNPIGSYPQVRAGAQAAAAWVNAELGGVDGRPVEIRTCVTRFVADQSRACAEDLIAQGVVAFVGGVDVMSTGSIPVLEQHGLATIGGIPANLVEQRSPNAVFFSGGDSGAIAAFMAHAAEQGRKKVALAYGQEVESFAVAARDYGAVVGRHLGLDVELVPYSVATTDYSPVLARIRDSGADAVVFLAATSACAPVMQGLADLQVRAQLYLTGACAADETIDAAGASSAGVIFNAEGPVAGDDVDASLYQDAVTAYATESAGGAGTVGFRGFMNLYALMRGAGADHVDSPTLLRLARSAKQHPSFWGHPYTCDGEQVPGLPALCAPQQVLFTRAPGTGRFRSVSEWIPTDALFAAAGVGGATAGAASKPVKGQRALVGRWAHYDVVAYQEGDIKTLIISYGFNDISERKGRLVDRASFCFAEQRTNQPIETSLSDAATQAIKPPPTLLTVDRVDGKLQVSRPATPTPVGIRLADAANEALPTDPNDPRVSDDDGDGKPGITVRIKVTDNLEGELYIARREIFAWDAVLERPNLMRGVVTDSSEQLVIGASNPIFTTSGQQWVQFPNLDESPVILRRVGANWDCERLRAERDRLFPPTPEADF